MTDVLSTKEIVKCTTLEIPKEMKKNVISVSTAFSVGILMRSQNIHSEEDKTKKLFEMIWDVE